MVSVDAAAKWVNDALSVWLYGVPDRTSCFAFTYIKPELERNGFNAEQIDRIMIGNPRKMLTM